MLNSGDAVAREENNEGWRASRTLFELTTHMWSRISSEPAFESRGQVQYCPSLLRQSSFAIKMRKSVFSSLGMASHSYLLIRRRLWGLAKHTCDESVQADVRLEGISMEDPRVLHEGTRNR